MSPRLPGQLSRRDFTRLFAFGGSAALFAAAGNSWGAPDEEPSQAPAGPDEAYWSGVRSRFLMPPNVAVLNAANLCPSAVCALNAMYEYTRRLDHTPSPAFREEMHQVKETTRRLLARYLRVTPEEIVITRNTSESNNLVSSGLDLRQGDEVVLFADNHPSINLAFREKAKRFGYSVKVIEAPNPHPGAGYYLEAFEKQMTGRTRLIAFSQVTNTVGDVLPAKELCRLARERGALSLVDGAQSFGVLDVDLGDLGPDFYTGSAHKWPCGPKETGLLYVHRSVHSRIWPTIYSAYPGAVGISATFEGFGQRDEPAILGFGEALKLAMTIGQGAIEARSRELTQALMEGLRRLDGVTLWTNPDPARSSTIVAFKPAGQDPKKLGALLFEEEGIIGAVRDGADRGGLRFCPHFYNTRSDIDRTIAAVQRHLRK
jgi:selenocysteine lyase/cysteine desulfurase